MNRKAAKTIVQIWLSYRYRWANAMPQILDDDTSEYEFGWVFCFRRPDRPLPRTYADFTGGEFPPVAIDRRDGVVRHWRRGAAGAEPFWPRLVLSDSGGIELRGED